MALPRKYSHVVRPRDYRDAGQDWEEPLLQVGGFGTDRKEKEARMTRASFLPADSFG